MRKRTILALSDFGTTGIAESLRAPLTHFHEQGHEIWHLALGYDGWANRIDREIYPWHERVLPIHGGVDNNVRFGQACIAQALEQSKADIVISAFDAWMVGYLAMPERAGLDERTRTALDLGKRKFTHVAYFPLDGAVEGKYVPPTLDEVIAGFDVPVTYSRFSQRMVRREMNLEIPFIPIAHDPKVYRPGSKRKAREELGLPQDRFIVGMVGTNQYRKLWGDFFEAVAPFAKAHSDVAILPWTTWSTKIMGGTEIPDLIWRAGIEKQVIDPAGKVGTLNDEGMARIYRALDVLVLCTVGEGAGLPPLRARACGVPALVSANTSNSEFCADRFEMIPTRGCFLDPFGSNIERYLTDTDVLRARLEVLYREPDFAHDLGRRGVAEMRQYEIDNVMPQWDTLLEEIK